MKRLMLISALVLFGCRAASGQEQPAQDSVMSPPYLAASHSFMMAMFLLDGGEVGRLLPDDLRANENERGLVAATLEMYETQATHGLPLFTAAFLAVEVAGYDSKDGAPGRFVVWGRVSSEAVLRGQSYHFGFPYVYSEHMSVSTEGSVRTGRIDEEDATGITWSIEKSPSDPFGGSGIVNMIGKREDGRIAVSEVPWLSNGHRGDLIRFEVGTQADPVLKVLESAAPIFTMVSDDQVFSYSAPITDYSDPG